MFVAFPESCSIDDVEGRLLRSLDEPRDSISFSEKIFEVLKHPFSIRAALPVGQNEVRERPITVCQSTEPLSVRIEEVRDQRLDPASPEKDLDLCVTVEREKEQVFQLIEAWAKDPRIGSEQGLNVRHVVAHFLADPKADYLNFDEQELSALPDIFHLPVFTRRLKTLYLSNNCLRTLPPSLARLSQLESLYLENNLLEEWPDVLNELPSLQYLNSSYNRLTEVPASLERLRSLRVLNLSYNRIQEIPETLGRLENLQSIKLAHNYLQQLPPSCTENPLFQKSGWRQNALPSCFLEDIPYKELPPFLQDDLQWALIQREFDQLATPSKDDKEFSFSQGDCVEFSDRLKERMVQTYQGKIREGRLEIEMQGKRFQLRQIKASLPHSWPRSADYHYYLLLSDESQTWVLDPSWKQFAGKKGNGTRKFLKEDPYNQRLLHEFPQILIAKRADARALMTALSFEAQDLLIGLGCRYYEEKRTVALDPIKTAMQLEDENF